MSWLTRTAALLIALFACPAFAADLGGGNKVICNSLRTWDENAGAPSSAFTVDGCGALITNTGTNSIFLHSAKMGDGTAGGLLRTLLGTATADCNAASTCGATMVPRGRYVLECDGAACTADVVGQ